MRYAPSPFGSLVVAVLLAAAAVPLVRGQTPPPQPLPASITGGAIPQPSPVSPASGTLAPPAAVAAPIARFQDLRAFPGETVQAVYAMRAGADWLWRMNQSNGRFFAGINPAVRSAADGDTEFRQAVAAWALADAARFTGDERFAARGTQAVLALLTLTRPDPADPTCRTPVTMPDRSNRVGFAAALALAVFALPNPEPKLLADADALCGFLRKQFQADGSVLCADGPADDLAALAAYPGLAVQALAASCRVKPEDGKAEVLARAAAYYRGAFKARPDAVLAANLIPGLVDFAQQGRKDQNTIAAVFELADGLCGCQYARGDARSPAWVGGFKTGPSAAPEPTLETAQCAAALSAAARLTRQIPDLARFRKYRQAAVDGLAFARGLQFTDENADHFERTFRTRFLTGGAHLTPSDGTVRLDATALVVAAHLAYLQSGAEGRAD